MYIYVKNNQILEYPIYDIRSKFPNTSFPAVIADSDLPEGYFTVKTVGESPSPGFISVPRDLPELVGNEWLLFADLVPRVVEINVVSPRQIRQAMTRTGIRQQVEDFIASSNDYDLKDWYEYATEFERTHPSVLVLASQLNIAEQQLDELWQLASTL